MKVERLVDGIRFVPEGAFELEALKDFRKHTIESMQFEQEWKQEGALEIKFNLGWGR